MKRIYYQGRIERVDPRLAGISLRPGIAVDVPEDLADKLCQEGNFSEEPTITWYEARPGEELLALRGIGESRAGWLVEKGISDLEAMARLNEDQIESLASQQQGISPTTIREWQQQAAAIIAAWGGSK